MPAEMSPRPDRGGRASVLEKWGWAATAGVAVIALWLSYAAFAFGPSNSAASTGTAKSSGAKTVDLEVGDLFIKPSMIEVPKDTDLAIVVKNTGAMAHDVTLANGKGTGSIAPGATATAALGVISEDTTAFCTVPGHKEAGMQLMIHVTGTTTTAGATAAAASAGSGGANPDDATIDFNAKPAADWKPYDPTLAPAPGGTTHDLTLHATEVDLEVAPGVTQKMWTFDNKVPGPILRGKVGDLFNITLVNDGTMGHSIDFHASKVAWSDEMRTIQPGESLVYQFKAGFAGAFMYHCGTAPTLHHIGNGMYGALIVDPPDLAPVDHEYVLVQSEIYTGPQGQPGDLTKMQNNQWDAVVFNGYVNQYKYSPIRVEPDQRVRVWVVDDGPSENSSFHIVGTIFDTVFKEGSYLLRPDARQGGSQALDLQPAQGGFVEFTFAETGFYPIVTHKFSNVGKGAMGLFQAGDAQMPAAGASH